MFWKLLGAIGVQKSGYRPKSIATELALGAVSATDYILWGYTFAALIFTGALAGYLPVAIKIVLVSTAVITIVVGLTSTFPVNIAGIEEKAVAILATIPVLIDAHYSEFSGADAAAATMFVIMGTSAICLGLAFYLAIRLNLSNLIQSMPFPVVCGFLAGTGWLLVSAGITLTAGLDVDVLDPRPMFQTGQLLHWSAALICGAALYGLIMTREHPLTLPLALLASALLFYALTWLLGLSPAALRSSGWIFHVDVTQQAKQFASLDFRAVNWSFVVSVLPQIGTIVLISILTASFSFSAFELATGRSLVTNAEMRGHGAANVMSGLILGMPGTSEVAISVMYWRMGARSRWLPITCGLACLGAAYFESGMLEWVPTITIGALVFMVGIQFLHEWLFSVEGQMSREDRATVWLIFGVIVVFGFVPGILVGIALASLLFIVRTSKIEVVGSSFSLDQTSSSVERSLPERRRLRELSDQVQIFNLRGFLFFGSANAFFERIKACCDQRGSQTIFVFNFSRVVGVDSTAVQVFLKINNLLESHDVRLVYCALNPTVLPAFDAAKVFLSERVVVLKNLDRAIEWTEDRLLAVHEDVAANPGIVAILGDILGDPEKSERLAATMEAIRVPAGEYLFRQGDDGMAIYVIESGVVELQFDGPDGQKVRFLELRRGSMFGEMTAYGETKRRPVSALVRIDAVVHRLEPHRLELFGAQAMEYKSILHEAVARLLAARLDQTRQRALHDL